MLVLLFKATFDFASKRCFAQLHVNRYASLECKKFEMTHFNVRKPALANIEVILWKSMISLMMDTLTLHYILNTKKKRYQTTTVISYGK